VPAPVPLAPITPATWRPILVPCYNEERAIAKVVADFRAVLPEATVYVYDNNCADGTVEATRRWG